MKQLLAPVAFLVAIVALWIGTIVGWIANTYWLFTSDAAITDVTFWVALVGTIAVPIGVVHGWIVIF